MAGLFALLPLGIGSAPVGASIGVQVAPARIDLAIKPSDDAIAANLTVINRGSERDTFTIAAVDVVVHDGHAEYLPQGATPYSLASLTTISPDTLTLDPGKEGTVKVRFNVGDHRPFLGALLVVPAHQASGGSASGGSGVGVVALPQALVTVSAAPVEANGELLPSIALDIAPISLSVPRVVESGPIIATATLRDTGNVYERVFSTYEFSNLGHVWLRVQAPPSSTMPNATASTSATTLQRLEASGQTVDTAPWLCICEVKVSTYAWLANRATTPPIVQTTYVVIFPWRLAGALLGLLALGFAARWTWRRRAVHRRP